VQAGSAETPCEQFLSAAVPAVQSLVAVRPAVQSSVPPTTDPPTVQVAGTELPVSQTPDPFAISPNGTTIGDSYFDFPLAFWSNILTSPFFNVTISYKYIYLTI
jgi:hypothetical protein